MLQTNSCFLAKYQMVALWFGQFDVGGGCNPYFIVYNNLERIYCSKKEHGAPQMRDRPEIRLAGRTLHPLFFLTTHTSICFAGHHKLSAGSGAARRRQNRVYGQCTSLCPNFSSGLKSATHLLVLRSIRRIAFLRTNICSISALIRPSWRGRRWCCTA